MTPRRPVSVWDRALHGRFSAEFLIFGFPRLSRVKTRQIDDIHEQHPWDCRNCRASSAFPPHFSTLTQAAIVTTFPTTFPLASHSTLGTEYSYEKAGRDPPFRRTTGGMPPSQKKPPAGRGVARRAGGLLSLAKSTEDSRRHDPSACAALGRRPPATTAPHRERRDASDGRRPINRVKTGYSAVGSPLMAAHAVVCHWDTSCTNIYPSRGCRMV